MYLDELLRLMREQQIHFAVVGKKSKYIGIVTLEDVLESIVGDIIDETDKIDRSASNQLQGSRRIYAPIAWYPPSTGIISPVV